MKMSQDSGFVSFLSFFFFFLTNSDIVKRRLGSKGMGFLMEKAFRHHQHTAEHMDFYINNPTAPYSCFPPRFPPVKKFPGSSLHDHFFFFNLGFVPAGPARLSN